MNQIVSKKLIQNLCWQVLLKVVSSTFTGNWRYRLVTQVFRAIYVYKLRFNSWPNSIGFIGIETIDRDCQQLLIKQYTESKGSIFYFGKLIYNPTQKATFNSFSNYLPAPMSSKHRYNYLDYSECLLWYSVIITGNR